MELSLPRRTASDIGGFCRTLRSPTAGIGTELFAPREKIEATRNSSPFERSPVPMGPANRHARAQFAHFPGERLKPETRWRMTQSAAKSSPPARESYLVWDAREPIVFNFFKQHLESTRSRRYNRFKELIAFDSLNQLCSSAKGPFLNPSLFIFRNH